MRKAARRRADPVLLNQPDLFAMLDVRPQFVSALTVPELETAPLPAPPSLPIANPETQALAAEGEPQPLQAHYEQRRQASRAASAKEVKKGGRPTAKTKRRTAPAPAEPPPTAPTAPTVPMRRFTPEEAAEMLAVSMKTLEAWRRLGKGPRFVKLGRSVRYALADLEDFSNARTVSNSAEGRMLDGPS